ncbi:MAG: 1-deoxy-D-xylulose-5-phosphate synthase [Candidatus Aegiribacteria sp.]|nr:1-deoxy-D-xylulose-5-phosphate synthase [Candidatus Aegiribacteria sp.]
MSVLDGINFPNDVSKLSMEDRLVLVDEIRDRIINVIRITGGHLASSLGVVELTVALLSVYSLPQDKIIWDVGHQTYPWKLLTGRADRFHTIRQSGGLSGFPRRDENPCDAFGTGHSSTSISAALGFALARDISGEDYKVVAVIGDGAMTAGMAFEGLNHLGHMGTDMLIILNDNDMSISPNVGAISRHLTTLITDPRYNRIKKDVWNVLGKIPSLGERVRKAAHAVTSGLKKTLVTPDTLFDDFGVRYMGPVPGNDLAAITGVLQRVSEISGPVLLHVETKKGKGFKPAELDATGYHGVSASFTERGNKRESFTSAFSRTMIDLGRSNEKIVAITAAMPDGTGLNKFAVKYPDRFFDVGIAEQHAVTLACGLAFGGLKPVVAIYSTFLQRAYDQVIHDAALQKAPIVLAVDRGGVVGEDGPTHHGMFDIPMLLPVPGLRIGAPRNCNLLEMMLRASVLFEEYPTAIRYPRGGEPDIPSISPETVLPGKGQLIREGKDVLVIGVGVMALSTLKAADILEKQGISVAVFDPIWLKPAPLNSIRELAAECGTVITVEDGVTEGGFGFHVRSILFDLNLPVLTLGFQDEFQTHATREELLTMAGLDYESLAERIGDFVGQ